MDPIRNSGNKNTFLAVIPSPDRMGEHPIYLQSIDKHFCGQFPGGKFEFVVEVFFLSAKIPID